MIVVLDTISKEPAQTIPFFISSVAYVGFNLAITAAEQGARVLVVSRPHLHPPKLTSDFGLIDIIDEDMTDENYDFICAKLSAVFDLIVFVRENEAFSGEAEEAAGEIEAQLVAMHLRYLSRLCRRSWVIAPEGDDCFNEERQDIVFSAPTVSETASPRSLH
jgi:hypothetical protein